MVSIALETNGKGFMGFLVEMPGAFVRGRSEEEVLGKVGGEAKSYLNWLRISRLPPSKGLIVERHSCHLMVEDADGEILLEADRGPLRQEEFQLLTELARYSAKTFDSLYDSSLLKDWVDPSRIRGTFYGETPKTIREILDHVNRTQYYYLSRTGIPRDRRENRFVDLREFCVERIESLFRMNGNSVVYDTDNELWTLKKILRRFIWHDRIHGKAIVKILAKQKRLGLIESYEDPLRFGLPDS